MTVKPVSETNVGLLVTRYKLTNTCMIYVQESNRGNRSSSIGTASVLSPKATATHDLMKLQIGISFRAEIWPGLGSSPKHILYPMHTAASISSLLAYCTLCLTTSDGTLLLSSTSRMRWCLSVCASSSFTTTPADNAFVPR